MKKKQKNVVVLIDAENVSYIRATEIERLAAAYGAIFKRRVYHLRGDCAARGWIEMTKIGVYIDVPLDGGPEKDKVDHKIQKDARHYLRSPKWDFVIVVSSDGGFDCLADEPSAREKLRFIGEKKAPTRLRKACPGFMELSEREPPRRNTALAERPAAC